MRFSALVSMALAITSALAIPVHQGEGKSSTVQYGRDVSDRRAPSLLHKRKQCNKGKTQTNDSYVPAASSTIDSYTSTPTGPSYEEEPSPSSTPNTYDPTTPSTPYSDSPKPKSPYVDTATGSSYVSENRRYGGRGGRGRGRKNGGSRNNSTTSTPSNDGTTTGNSPYTSPSTSPNTDYSNDTPTSYGSGMPSGSSTGLSRGSSVRNVGPDGTFMSESAIKPYLVAAHNIVRALHEGTGSIVWDSSIAKLAEANTPNCDFQHTPSAKRKGLGENISYNTNANPEDQALRQWYANEVVNYNFNDPSNSDGVIGHMTAMVWKDVKSFGCAVRNCGAHGMGLYLKCNYSPVPNIIGKYDQKVGKVIGASSDSQLRSIVEKATGFTPK